MFYVYKITCGINGKSYIGVTNNLVRRYKQHIRGQSHAVALISAIKKYGYDNFNYIIIETFQDAISAGLVEKECIISHNTISPDGYNLAIGAPFTIYAGVFSETTKRKQSESQKGNKNHLGKKHTEETKQKLSNYFKGRKMPDDYISPLKGKPNGRRGQPGHKQSEESRRKIAEKLHKHIRTKEHRDNIASAHRGKIVSKETRQKIAKSLKEFYFNDGERK